MSVLVATRPSPFELQRSVIEIEAGRSIAELVAIVLPDERWHSCAHVTLGGDPVPRQHWQRIWPKEGATIAITIIPGNGNALRIALTIAVIAAAAWAGPAAAGALGLVNSAGALTATGMMVSAAVGMAVSTVGMLAVNALVPPQMPGLDKGGRGSPAYSIVGARNTARLRGPIPIVLGRHRITPPLAASTITEIAGEDVYLRMLVCWGYGPITLEDIRIGETPIDQFEGVELEHFFGTAGQLPQLALYSDDIHQENLGIELTEDAGWVSRTTQAGLDEISIDITLPRGLIIFGKKTGDKITHTLTIDVAYRLVGEGSWTNHPSLVITEKTTKTVRRNIRIPVTSGQYEVRLRRGQPDEEQDRKISDVQWTALRSITHTSPVQEPGVAVTALRIKASEQLSGTIDELNGIVSSVALDWDEPSQTWIERVTRNPASLMRRALQGTGAAEPLDNADLDLAQLEYWHQQCDTAGWLCDLVVDFEASDDEVIGMIAACGMASQARPKGLRSVVIDEPVTSHVQDLSPRTMTGFRQRRIFFEPAHAFRVNFFNEAAGWKLDERLVYADGHDEATATRIEDLELPGITSADLVWRHGRRRMAEAALRQETTEIDTDWRHLAATRGDVIRVAHDAVLWGTGWGRIKSVETDGNSDVTAVTLDEVIPLEAGKSYALRIQRSDGSSDAWSINTIVGESARLVLSSPIPAIDAPAAGDHAVIGEPERETVELLIIGIAPGPDLTATLVCVPYDSRVYDPDLETIPEFQSFVTPPAGADVPLIVNIRSDETVAQRRADGSVHLQAIVTLYNDGSRPSTVIRGVELRWREVGGSPDSSESWRRVTAAWDAVDVVLEGVEPGVLIEIEARYLLETGAGTWSAAQQHQVIGADLVPPDPTSAWQDGDVLRWTAPLDPDHAGWLLRIAAAAGTPWDAATPLHVGRYAHDLIELELIPAHAAELLVKSVTVAGIESVVEVRTSIDHGAAPALTAISTADHAADGWPDRITGGVVQGSLLAGVSSTAMWPDATAAAWPDPSAAAFDLAFDALVYEASWPVPASARLTDRIRIEHAASGEHQLELRWGNDAQVMLADEDDPDLLIADDDPMPESNLPFGAVSVSSSTRPYAAYRASIRPVLGETLEVRITVQGGSSQPQISMLRIHLEAEEISQAFPDQAVGTGGTWLVPAQPLRRILRVLGTLQGTGDAAVALRVLDKSDPAAGALVGAYGSSGSPVSATADLLLTGV